MPGFFDEVDSLGIVEDHINAVLALEAAQSDKIIASYSEVRNRLVDRLARLPGGSFTAQHLRGVLAQVQGAIDAMNKGMRGNLREGAVDLSTLGINNLVEEIQLFDQEFSSAITPININAAVAAQDTANFLVDKYQTNLDAYGNDLLTQISNGLFSAALGETNHEEVVGRIAKFFTAEEWKLRRIVRTELHNIYNVGKLQGMGTLAETQVPDLKKTLMHPLDSRTGKDSVYAATLGLVAEIDEPFFYVWKGKPREFMAPPDRPNDRAILVPYRDEWGEAVGGSFVPEAF